MKHLPLALATLVSILAFLLTGCASPSPYKPSPDEWFTPGDPQPETPGEAITIPLGFVGPLTGELAYMGSAQKVAVELALADANLGRFDGLRFDVVAVDSADGPEAALELLQSQEVWAVVGDATSMVTEALGPLARETATVVLSPSADRAGLVAGNPWLFRTQVETGYVPRALGDFLRRQQELDSLEVIREDDGDSQAWTEAVMACFVAAGGREVRSQVVKTGDELATIRPQAVRPGLKHGILVSGSRGFMNLVWETKIKAGWQGSLVFSSWNLEPLTFGFFEYDLPRSEAGTLVVRGVTTKPFLQADEYDQAWQRYQDFENRFREVMGVEPDLWACNAYDAATILAAAASLLVDEARAAGVQDLEAYVRQGLASRMLTMSTGIRKPFTFDAEGNPILPLEYQSYRWDEQYNWLTADTLDYMPEVADH